MQGKSKGGPKRGDTPSRDESAKGTESVTLDETTLEDTVAESWDHWIVSRKDSPTTESDEAPSIRHKTLRGLRRDLSWVAKEISDQQKGTKSSAGQDRRHIVLLRRMGLGSRGDLGRASLNCIKERLRGLLRTWIRSTGGGIEPFPERTPSSGI